MISTLKLNQKYGKSRLKKRVGFFNYQTNLSEN